MVARRAVAGVISLRSAAGAGERERRELGLNCLVIDHHRSHSAFNQHETPVVTLDAARAGERRGGGR